MCMITQHLCVCDIAFFFTSIHICYSVDMCVRLVCTISFAYLLNRFSFCCSGALVHHHHHLVCEVHVWRFFLSCVHSFALQRIIVINSFVILSLSRIRVYALFQRQEEKHLFLLQITSSYMQFTCNFHIIFEFY